MGSPLTFLASVKGKGRIEVHLDSPTGDLLTSLDFDSPNAYTAVYNDEVAAVGGVRDLYFVFSDAGISMRSWTFAAGEASEKVRGDVNADGSFTVSDIVMMQKYLLRAGTLKAAQNGDLCEDGVLNVLDLTVMKRELLNA